MDSKTYPKPVLRLIGTDGNAFAIMGKALRVLKPISQDLADEYLVKAKSGDYDNLLAVTMEYCDVI